MVTTNSEVFAGVFSPVFRSYVCPQCDKSLANVPGLFKPALVAAHLSQVVWVLDFLIVYSFVSKFPSSLFFCLFADEIYTSIHANTHPPMHTHLHGQMYACTRTYTFLISQIYLALARVAREVRDRRLL